MAKADYQRDYYAANRERRLAESCDYQRGHADERRSYNAAYYAANKGRIAAQAAEYRARTAVERKAKRKAEYAANPERFKRATKEWQAANPGKRLDQRMRKYGITGADYARMFADQNGRCAVCDSVETGDKRGGRFHVDHCHESGRIRGLLCSQCNLGLGKFKDSADLLERASLYLRAS